jgi:RecB family exonuclease
VSILPYEHVSHSQLTSWAERCQKEFQLRRIQRAPSLPAWWLVGGSAVHEVTEDLDRRGLEFGLTPAEMNVTLDIEDLFESKLDQLIQEEEEKSGVLSKDWLAAGVRPPQDGNHWRAKGPQMVANWLTWRETTGWELAMFDDEPGIELDLKLTLDIGGEEREVVGAVDRVFVLPNEELVIDDIKSGSSTPSTPMQQGLYATLIEKRYGRRPKYGTFTKVGPKYGGQHTPLAPLKKYDERYFEQLFTAFRAQVETGTFLPNVSDSCRTCGVAGSCYAAGGLQSADFDPLDPNYQGVQ